MRRFGMDGILIAIALLLTVAIGIEGVRITEKLMCGGAERAAVIIPVGENEPSVELRVRQITRMLATGGCDMKIILLNVGADNETLEICRKICQEKSFVELCGADDNGGDLIRFFY